jgi:hypothetical protein
MHGTMNLKFEKIPNLLILKSLIIAFCGIIIIKFTIILHPLFVRGGPSPFYSVCEQVFLTDDG